MPTNPIPLQPGRLFVKDTVRFTGTVLEILDALPKIVRVFAAHGLYCLVTAANDSEHKVGSFHYLGKAIDLRTHHIQEGQSDRPLVGVVLHEVAQALGAAYDVILEGLGTDNEHMHVEFDPD